MLMKHGVKFNFDISSFSPEIQQLFKEYHDLTVEHLHGIHGDREEILNADRKRSEIHTAIAKELVIAGLVSPMRVARGLVAVINAENEAKLLQDAKLTDSVRLRYMMGAKQ